MLDNFQRSSHPEVFLEKSILKICSKFTGEHPRQSVISIKLLCKFVEIALQHGCSLVNLLHIFRTSFLKITSGGLLLFLPVLSQLLIIQASLLGTHRTNGILKNLRNNCYFYNSNYSDYLLQKKYLPTAIFIMPNKKKCLYWVLM